MQFFNGKVSEVLEHLAEGSYGLSVNRGPLRTTNVQNNTVIEDLLCRSWD